MTEYRILAPAIHRSGGGIQIPLAVGKSGRVVNVSLSQEEAFEATVQLVRALRVEARA